MYQIFHPLLTTCMIPIVVMFVLNFAILKRFRNSSTNTRNKMRYLFPFPTFFSGSWCLYEHFLTTLLKQARDQNVGDDDGHLRHVRANQHAEDSAGPVWGNGIFCFELDFGLWVENKAIYFSQYLQNIDQWRGDHHPPHPRVLRQAVPIPRVLFQVRRVWVFQKINLDF